MGTIDRRSAFYDDGEPREETAIVASSTTSIEDKEEGVKTIPVNVPPGATNLTVALTGPENKPGNIAPAGVLEVRLEHEEGGPVAPLAPDNAYGRVLFVVDDPRPGRWRVIVRHARDSSFVVRAVAMRDRAVEYIREKWPSIRCTACKESLNASVALAVGILSGGAAGVFAGSTLAYLVGRTRLPEHVIKYLMERMFDTSIDRLVEGACERMQMCAA